METVYTIDNISGLVLLRDVLSAEEKATIYDIIWSNAKFYTDNGELNFITKRFQRGRDGFLIANLAGSDELTRILTRLKRLVELLDPTLVFVDPNYVLMQYYPNMTGIARHYDSHGGNNGDEGAPVYSLSLGASCNFRYSLVGEKTKRNIMLSSGDLLVFGGAQRLMMHEVTSIDLTTLSGDENCHNARINLTFRTCTGFTDEDELKYKTDNYLKLMRAEYK